MQHNLGTRSSFILLLIAAPLTAIAQGDGSAATPPEPEIQIAHSVLALPEGLRDSAAVMGYNDDLELISLRDGHNGLICVADKPGDDSYSVVCYHESLDPFISRGRQLRDEGVEGADAYKIRHDEMDAGTLGLPDAGATLYNMSMPLADFDPDMSGPALYSIYTPYATGASTGLPERPAGPAMPWIMRGGTPSAHVMVIVPQPEPEEEEEKEY